MDGSNFSKNGAYYDETFNRHDHLCVNITQKNVVEVSIISGGSMQYVEVYVMYHRFREHLVFPEIFVML